MQGINTENLPAVPFLLTPISTTEDCCICLDKGGRFINHVGATHAPIHQKCIAEWLSKGQANCPLCKRKISNLSDLKSFLARAMDQASEIQKNSMNGINYITKHPYFFGAAATALMALTFLRGDAGAREAFALTAIAYTVPACAGLVAGYYRETDEIYRTIVPTAYTVFALFSVPYLYSNGIEAFFSTSYISIAWGIAVFVKAAGFKTVREGAAIGALSSWVLFDGFKNYTFANTWAAGMGGLAGSIRRFKINPYIGAASMVTGFFLANIAKKHALNYVNLTFATVIGGAFGGAMASACLVLTQRAHDFHLRRP